MAKTIQNLPGTLIPQVSKELFKNRGGDSVFEQTKLRRKLTKIIADTELGDDRGDICTDPTHKHPREWHHGVSYPESGGVFVYHLSFPYPEKGTKDDTMMMSIQFVKRVLINWLKFLSYKWTLLAFSLIIFFPWKYKIKIVERFITSWLNYAGLVDNQGRHYILEKRYYSLEGRELMKGMEVFFTEIGLSVADQLSWTITAIVDNDSAYYYRRGDIMSEASKENFLKNPSKELSRLLQIFAERESRPHMVEKFKTLALPIKLALLHPRVKKAFKKSIESMDFNNLGLDEADQYHVRTMSDYNFFGMTHTERINKWPLEQHTLSEIIW